MKSTHRKISENELRFRSLIEDQHYHQAILFKAINALSSIYAPEYFKAEMEAIRQYSNWSVEMATEHLSGHYQDLLNLISELAFLGSRNADHYITRVIGDFDALRKSHNSD